MAGVLPELFQGHAHTFLQCLNVECTSMREEGFMDLQLDVKGCRWEWPGSTVHRQGLRPRPEEQTVGVYQAMRKAGQCSGHNEKGGAGRI